MYYRTNLYKKDSKGKIRVLFVSANEITEGQLIQRSGLLDGKQVTHSSICKPKNIGKVNETTPSIQAIAQAEALVKKKLDEGYFKTIEEAENGEVILPMLAKDFKKEVKKVKYPCYCQPKLDGMRALGSENNTLTSRKGKKIDTVKHLQFNHLNGAIIDGELYAHGKTFQENMSLIKKAKKGSEEIKFHVYDLISDKPFIQRYELLYHLTKNSDSLILVPTIVVNNEKQLKAQHSKYISQGYEGTIVRHSDAGYGINKRDSQLLKYKDFIDLATKVIDVVPSDKNPKQGVIVCDGFRCGMKFSHAEREEILKNKENYIGKTVEVRFFEYTDDGLPRFPVAVGFRLDK